jgi:uncharacterized damage-inducible protein DinB
MTNREFLIAKRKAEQPIFLRVLKALPADRLDYRPDPKSRSAAELAWLIADEEQQLLQLLRSGKIEFKETPPPGSLDAIVTAFERDVAAVNEGLAKLDEAGWEKNGQFIVGGNVVWEDKVGELFWGFLLDAVHHRGQLTVYLRPMGGKVPSIYGPSADDPGK